MLYTGANSSCPSYDQKYKLEVNIKCISDAKQLNYEKVDGSMCAPKVYFSSPTACPLL